jgi:hypothetical protein
MWGNVGYGSVVRVDAAGGLDLAGVTIAVSEVFGVARAVCVDDVMRLLFCAGGSVMPRRRIRTERSVFPAFRF